MPRNVDAGAGLVKSTPAATGRGHSTIMVPRLPWPPLRPWLSLKPSWLPRASPRRGVNGRGGPWSSSPLRQPTRRQERGRIAPAAHLAVASSRCAASAARNQNGHGGGGGCVCDGMTMKPSRSSSVKSPPHSLIVLTNEHLTINMTRMAIAMVMMMMLMRLAMALSMTMTRMTTIMLIIMR